MYRLQTRDAMSMLMMDAGFYIGILLWPLFTLCRSHVLPLEQEPVDPQ